MDPLVLPRHKLLVHLESQVAGLKEAPDELSENLLTVSSKGELFVWSNADHALFAVNLAAGAVAAEKEQYIKLIAFPPVPHDVVSIGVNSTDKYVMLVGRRECTVLELPRRSKDGAIRGEGEITCRAIPVAKHAPEAGRILKALWHPLSGTHIALLAADSKLRLYNVAGAPRHAEQEFALVPRRQDEREGRSGVSESEDEEKQARAVSFAFGANVGWDVLSIYYVLDTGKVYVLCPVLPDGCVLPSALLSGLMRRAHGKLVHMRHQFSASRHSTVEYQWRLQRRWIKDVSNGIVDFAHLEDDEVYTHKDEPDTEWVKTSRPDSLGHECVIPQGPFVVDHRLPSLSKSDKAVDIVCIDATPPVIVTARSSGCLDVLLRTEEIDPKWRTGMEYGYDFPDEVTDAGVDLEDIERPLVWHFERKLLELPQPVHDPKDPSVKQQNIVRLTPDPSNPERLFVHHPFGAHRITFPWLRSMSGFCERESGGLGDLPTSTAQALLLTSPLDESKPAPVVGVAVLVGVVTSRHAVLLMTSFLRLHVVPLTSLPAEAEAALHAATLLLESGPSVPHESNRILKPLTTFTDAAMSKELIPKLSLPNKLTFPAALNDETVAYFMGLTKRAKAEGVALCVKMQAEIMNRLKLHATMIKEQEEQLTDVHTKQTANDQREVQIKDKLRAIHEFQQVLKKRIALILEMLLSWQPELSTAETEYHEELERRARADVPRLKERLVELKAKTQSELGTIADQLSSSYDYLRKLMDTVDRGDGATREALKAVGDVCELGSVELKLLGAAHHLDESTGAPASPLRNLLFSSLVLRRCFASALYLEKPSGRQRVSEESPLFGALSAAFATRGRREFEVDGVKYTLDIARGVATPVDGNGATLEVEQRPPIGDTPNELRSSALFETILRHCKAVEEALKSMGERCVTPHERRAYASNVLKLQTAREKFEGAVRDYTGKDDGPMIRMEATNAARALASAAREAQTAGADLAVHMARWADALTDQRSTLDRVAKTLESKYASKAFRTPLPRGRHLQKDKSVDAASAEITAIDEIKKASVLFGIIARDLRTLAAKARPDDAAVSRRQLDTLRDHLERLKLIPELRERVAEIRTDLDAAAR